MMYRVLFALLAGKAAGFSSMPDPGCTAVGPQTDAFPGIGVHFSPAGRASWAENFGPETPCGPYCSAEFTITTDALEGATDVERFMSLADNPVLAAVAEAFNLNAGITYTPGCASGPEDGPAGGFPGALCGGVGDDRYGWWSKTCRDAVGCAACHDCFFPDGYPSECMQNRSGLPYTEFTPRSIFDYMPTTDAAEAWMGTGFGACSEACAERPDEKITVYGPGPCPEGVSPYLCFDDNPWIQTSFPNTTSFPTEILACSDDYAGAIVGWGDTNFDHYGWGDPEGVAAVGCQPCSDCFFPQGYPPQGDASINAPPMIPYGPSYDSWPFKGAAWSPAGYTEWCSPFSDHFKPCDGSWPPETPDVDVSVVGGRRRKLADTKTGPKMSDQLAANVAKFSAIFGNGKK